MFTKIYLREVRVPLNKGTFKKKINKETTSKFRIFLNRLKFFEII